MWHLAAACALGIFLLWIMVLWLARRQAQTRQADIVLACTPEVVNDSIYVLVPTVDSDTIGALLKNLFHHARCPRRVFVEVLEGPHQHILGSYIATCVGDNVAAGLTHVLSTPLAHHLKTPCAGYHNERFILILDGAARVVPQWDQLLIEEWTRVQNFKAILSTQPALAETVWSVRTPAPRLELDTTATTAPFLMWKKTATVAATVDPQHDVVKSVGWTYQCSFSLAVPTLPLLQQVMQDHTVATWDFHMAELMAHPPVYHPTRHIAFQ
jgi:hypothetical protein